MPDTSLGITYPASTAHTRIWEHVQTVADDVNTLLALPAMVEADGAASNAITATSFAAIPTTPVSASLVVPAGRDLLVAVTIRAVLIVTASGDLRASLLASGAATWTPGAGNAQWSRSLWCGYVGGGVSAQEKTVYLTCTAGQTLTASIQAYKTGASGAWSLNYPSLSIQPLRYV